MARRAVLAVLLRGATLKEGRAPISINGIDMKTYTFKAIVEPDEDRWHAYCPALHQYGAATWGDTREEAFQHIQEVVQMIIDELREDGIALPVGPKEDVEVFAGERVATFASRLPARS